MAQEAVGRTEMERRLTELELKVDVLNRVPITELALASSNCCNSCNNVKATDEFVTPQAREGQAGA